MTEPQRRINAFHEQLLRERAIPLDYAVAHGLASVDLRSRKADEKKYKLKKAYPDLPLHPVTGLLIRYQTCLDGVERLRVRSDVTEYVKEGPEPGVRGYDETVQVPRYICQAGVSVAPYLIDEVLKVAADIAIPVHIVEAPLKALSLSANGFLAIGLGGVTAGASDSSSDEILAHPELRRIVWAGRRVYVTFDAGLGGDDAPGNPMVALGASRVAKALRDLGADVWLVRVPYYHPQQSNPEAGQIWKPTDQGPDDYIARNGAAAFQTLVDVAQSADVVARLRVALEDQDPLERALIVGEMLRDLFTQACLYCADAAELSAVATLTGRAGVTKRGLQDVVKKFKAQLGAKLRAAQPSWTRELLTSAGGTARLCRENIEIALRNDPGLSGLLAFDEFAQQIVFTREPPWSELYVAAEGTVNGAPYTDADDVRLAGYLAKHAGLIDLPEKKVRAAVIVMAREKTIHPVRAYLRGLEWDQTPRVANWLTTYLGVAASDYTRAVGQWWLISAVARIMNPGCKADHTLILEGNQGDQKSTALEVLGGVYYSDGDLGDLAGKESALQLQGVWILELAEGEIFSKASTKALKAFATKKHDDVILKYSNLRTRLPRQCVFGLTVNEFADYLVDSTGNRRFWPVRVGSIDVVALRRDRDLLWAEAVQLYKEGAKWWPSSDEERSLCREQVAGREVRDVWEARVADVVATLERTTLSAVLGLLGVRVEDQNRGTSLRMSRCLQALGWVEAHRTKHDRFWERGPTAVPLKDSLTDAEIALLFGTDQPAAFEQAAERQEDVGLA